MKRTDKETEMLAINLYKQGYSFVEISSLLKEKGINLCSVTIYNICKRYNIKSRNKGGKEEYTSDEIQRMKDMYFNQNMTLADIADTFSCVPNTIKKFVSKENNYAERVKLNYRNQSINKDYFKEIDTEAKAYILGYFLADGNVYTDKSSKRIRIALQYRDIEFLEFIKNEIGIESKILHRYKQSKNVISHQVSLAFASDEIFDDLGKYGIVPNKTRKTYLYPFDNVDIMRHYIRGILDGDGCITYNGKNGCSVSFSGYYNLMRDIHDYLVKELNISNTKISTHFYSETEINRNDISCISWSKHEDVEKIAHFLYDNSTVYLNRKKEKLILRHFL